MNYSDDKNRACIEKRQYTKNQARSGAADMSRKMNKVYDYYPCDYCGKWHIGKRPEYYTGPKGVRFRAMEFFPFDQIIEQEEKSA